MMTGCDEIPGQAGDDEVVGAGDDREARVQDDKRGRHHRRKPYIPATVPPLTSRPFDTIFVTGCNNKKRKPDDFLLGCPMGFEPMTFRTTI